MTVIPRLRVLDGNTRQFELARLFLNSTYINLKEHGRLHLLYLLIQATAVAS